jgi:hypothetical protein
MNVFELKLGLHPNSGFSCSLNVYFCLSMVGNGLFWSSILREILVGVAPPLSMMMSSGEGRAPLPSPPSLRLKVRSWLCDERWSPRNFSGAMKYPVSCTD